ncbi:hypothetical protein [Synechococcus sp. CS-1328]|uniref:hypothetical protein n=1 Tax=Synechococcus sp. CS-1328 TaxID=2847976 RepID=UPI00223AE83C|nr:hypothetical protein [Synechococcus sp. CS-1328]MCT0225594.1 hypothetical protein [Synechococcus sp. CS-1328]
MSTQLLLTHHHREAMTNACDRGFWMPLPIPADQSDAVGFLTALSPGATAIRAIAEVTGCEPWREPDGSEQGLLFLGRMIPLLRPIPLGDLDLLAGWLPSQRDQLQLLPLQALLRAERLSDLLSGSAASCPLTSMPAAARRRAAAMRRRGRAA